MTTIPDTASLKKFKLAELVELCKQNSISSTGKKDELISRLSSLQATKENENGQSAELNADNLDSLDWEHDDLGDLNTKLESETKQPDASTEDSKSKDPTSSDPKTAPTDENSSQADTNEPKKTIRTLGTIQVSLSEAKTEAVDPDKRKEQLAAEEEKRKLRAQRFGAAEPVKRKSPTQSNFENPKKTPKPNQPSPALKVNEDPELLKKRQEKFGAKSAPITAPKESKIISLSLSNTSKDSTQ